MERTGQLVGSSAALALLDQESTVPKALKDCARVLRVNLGQLPDERVGERLPTCRMHQHHAVSARELPTGFELANPGSLDRRYRAAYRQDHLHSAAVVAELGLVEHL